jgi:hypothetical protein
MPYALPVRSEPFDAACGGAQDELRRGPQPSEAEALLLFGKRSILAPLETGSRLRSNRTAMSKPH